MSVRPKHLEINKKIYTVDVRDYVNALIPAFNDASSIREDRASKMGFKFIDILIIIIFIIHILIDYFYNFFFINFKNFNLDSDDFTSTLFLTKEVWNF